MQSSYCCSEIIIIISLKHPMNSSTPIYKVVVLGEGRVGKTSMTLKYVKNEFNDDQESSINACYL